MKANKIIGLLLMLVLVSTVKADLADPEVGCEIIDTNAPNASNRHDPCSSFDASIEVTPSSDGDTGTQVDGLSKFEMASKLFVRLKSDSNENAVTTVKVIGGKPASGMFDNAGKALRSIISRNYPTDLEPVVSTPPLADSSFVKKDLVVVVEPDSKVNTLTIDSSSYLPSQHAGNVVAIINNNPNVTIKANGYNGADGEDPSVRLARASIVMKKTGASDSDILPGLRPELANSYFDRIATNTNAVASSDLVFGRDDYNNYAASGLGCGAGETALSTGSSSDYLPSAPRTMSVTALKREVAKRASCSRGATYRIAQDCEAEK
ncbi:MAG: hypothetical protein EOP06_04210, partial [Proteobacteria bacterium]